MASKLKTPEQRSTRTVVDTVGFTRREAESWKIPSCQRPLRVNDKVRLLAEQIGSDGGVIPGILTFGVLAGEKFLIDGQHRREAFVLSGKEEGFADTRTCFFDSMADMGEEFIRLNSALVRMRPDDMLRGLENSLAPIRHIREQCPFVGFDFVRRNTSSPVVSMAAVMRQWAMSARDCPSGTGEAAAKMARDLTQDDAEQLVSFLKTVYGAWGRDSEYVRLWGSLNITLCMWLFRRTVLTEYSAKSVRMSKELFEKCAMGLSASRIYMDWLVGRQMNDRDRAPAYSRIKAVFQRRVQEETGEKVKFPAPAWAPSRAGNRQANV